MIGIPSRHKSLALLTGVLLAQAGKVMQSLFGCGRARQQKIEAILNGGGKMRRQSHEFARGARAVPVGEVRQTMHEELRGFVQQLDGIAGMDGSRLQDGGVKPAQAPQRRRRNPSFHFLIIDRLLNARAVYVQRVARRA